MADKNITVALIEQFVYILRSITYNGNRNLEKRYPFFAFGENLTVTNMLEADVCIGDIYKIGDAVIQITQGRIPCSTIDRYTEANTLLKRLIETGYTGFLARVLEEGTICADSTIELVEKHPARISVLYCNEVYFKTMMQSL